MTLYITGDKHGEITDFSSKNCPELKHSTSNDIVVIAGDCGFIWSYEHTKHSNQDRYALNWLNKKGPIFICLCGNHENYSVIKTMPQIEKFGGIVRQTVYENIVYDNIYWVDCPTILNLDNNNVLLIPGAESHDVQYRTKYVNWWPEEKGDISADRDFIQKNCDKYFDFVITHAAPGSMNQVWKPCGCRDINTTPREMFYEHLRQQLNFGCWIHGHNHENMFWHGDSHGVAVCMYWSVIESNELLKMAKQKKYEFFERESWFKR